MSGRHSMLVSNVDKDHFNSFRAKRQAEKDAKRALLAKEFPLLFGSDSKSRSTIGKYANKTVPTTQSVPITPGKRKTQSTLGLKPQMDENCETNGSATISSRQSMANGPTSATKNRKKSDVFSKAMQSPKKSSRQTIAASSNARGSFLNYRSFSNQKVAAPVSEVEMFANEKEAVTAAAETAVVSEEIVALACNDPLQEQVHDVLDYLLETNEVDESTHRRLSSQAFQKNTLRRLSMRASLTPEDHNQPDNAAQESTGTAPPSEAEFAIDQDADASIDIDDMDVLQALRTYISTLDAVPTTSICPPEVPTEDPPVVIRSNRSKLGFTSPTPNTRVISITSPVGSHFKRPKQVSSPNPIRFPSRNRRDSNSGFDEEQPASVANMLMKTPPPATTTTAASKTLVSPNPMRLADAFRRGSVSGRKSILTNSQRKQSFLPENEPGQLEEDDVLGLMAAMDALDSMAAATPSATEQKSAKKKQSQAARRRSSATGGLPAVEQEENKAKNAITTAVEVAADEDDFMSTCHSIINSPSLKTMRVSFLCSSANNNSSNSYKKQNIAEHALAVIANEYAEHENASSVSPSPLEPAVVAVNTTKEEGNTEMLPLPMSTDSTVIITSVTADIDAVVSVAEEPVTAPAEPAPAVEEFVVMYPRQFLYLAAMKKGVVHAELSNCLYSKSSNPQNTTPNVKYVIHVSMLPLPGNATAYATLEMMLLKKFSEFRYLHQRLVTCPGVNVEKIPTLPSRSVASLGGGEMDTETSKTREKALRQWLDAVFVRQSSENDAYRQALVEFLSQ